MEEEMIEFMENMRFLKMSDLDLEKRGLKREDLQKKMQSTTANMILHGFSGNQYLVDTFWKIVHNSLQTDMNAHAFLTRVQQDEIRSYDIFGHNFMKVIQMLADMRELTPQEWSNTQTKEIATQLLHRRIDDMMDVRREGNNNPNTTSEWNELRELISIERESSPRREYEVRLNSSGYGVSPTQELLREHMQEQSERLQREWLRQGTAQTTTTSARL